MEVINVTYLNGDKIIGTHDNTVVNDNTVANSVISSKPVLKENENIICDVDIINVIFPNEKRL